MPEKEALANMLEILETEDLREVLYKIRLPIQFVNGTEDHICPLGIFAHLKEKLPQARFDWFHQCGHFPFISQPHEYNLVLEDFLKTTDDIKTDRE
jgi:pimeloyl-ACP methyl ester carboxylesterase